MKMPRLIRTNLILLIISLTYISNAFGFSINPMFLDMKPNGGQARSVVTVKSSSPNPMPVRVTVSEVILDEAGNIRAVPNDKDFLVFPPQVVIKPYGRQSFRVQWRGNPNLQEGKTYEVVVGQVLAKDKRLEKNNALSLSVQFALAFGSIINMPAASGSPRPVVKSSRLSLGKSGKVFLDTIVSNNSNQNFLMVQADSTVTAFGAKNQRLWSYTYSPDDMMRVNGLGVVQPYKSRRMKIPLVNFPKELVAKTKLVRLEVRPSAN